MCRAMPFSARILKEKHFLWRWHCDKKQIEMWFIIVYTLITNAYASLPFPKHFFSYCFCMLKKFGKVFERKVWCIQVAHLHNAARALLSRSWCFQLWTIVDKDFFRYLWYCGKKQIKRGLARSALLSTTIRVITVVKICCETLQTHRQSTRQPVSKFVLPL